MPAEEFLHLLIFLWRHSFANVDVAICGSVTGVRCNLVLTLWVGSAMGHRIRLTGMELVRHVWLLLLFATRFKPVLQEASHRDFEGHFYQMLEHPFKRSVGAQNMIRVQGHRDLKPVVNVEGDFASAGHSQRILHAKRLGIQVIATISADCRNCLLLVLRLKRVCSRGLCRQWRRVPRVRRMGIFFPIQMFTLLPRLRYDRLYFHGAYHRYKVIRAEVAFVAFFNVGSKETIPSVPSVPFSTMAGRVVVWNCVPCGFVVLHQYTRCSSVPLLRRKRAGMLTVRQQLLASCQLDHQHVMAQVSGDRQTAFYSLTFQHQSLWKAWRLDSSN